MSAFYSFTARTLGGKEVSMEEFRGKSILVVNTASKCGLTPQFAGLEALYQKYRDQGLVVLGFPCNQFGNQEPGNATDITDFCTINYGVTFPMFEKVDVNGPDAHPLFKYLQVALPGLLGGRIHWNFTKFLIDDKGNPVKRFAPFTQPEQLEGHLTALLKRRSFAVSPS